MARTARRAIGFRAQLRVQRHIGQSVSTDGRPSPTRDTVTRSPDRIVTVIVSSCIARERSKQLALSRRVRPQRAPAACARSVCPGGGAPPVRCIGSVATGLLRETPDMPCDSDR